MIKAILNIFVLVILVFYTTKENIGRSIENIELQEEKSNEYIIVDNIEIDEEKFMKSYYEESKGILLYKSDEITKFNDWDSGFMVEMIFTNPISKKEIYYTGADYRGSGVFWIMDRDTKEIILETGVRYGPIIIWHGENIAEIEIPTGSPNRHSYYFDFRDKKLSKGYNFPIYYDIETDIVLIWGFYDFELYDIKTDELIYEYYIRRNANMAPSMPMPYYIEKENEQTIFFYYDDAYNKRKGRFIIDISK
ncbi:MAG: hypothetical protein LBQ93_07115 [Treponema sp.]|jgi:hypothetical protein|nr:hypothetical protein [Treponema sp.]